MHYCLFILLSCIKLLFIPAYRSTDFEVHRNWLAITHSLPLSQWYYEETSEWTLDYPPFFAYFEYLLSCIAKYVDPEMLKVDNLNYASEGTIVFQRISVVVTDIVFAYGSKECGDALGKQNTNPRKVLSILLLSNTGLFMVDHIHFQYNGMMFGILLISIARIMQEKHLSAAFWFAVLLNMKHIYAYLAPAYVVYLLRAYCMEAPVSYRKICRRLFYLLGIVIATCAVSFGPFIQHMPQVLARLFPFKRGLCHAYWAPNFWALYNFVDKATTAIAPRFGISINSTVGSMTGGLVQEFPHSVLPTISPKVTFILTLMTITPALVKLWRLLGASKSGAVSPLHFIRCLVICGAGAFLFGWHVHEKAILMLIIPLMLLAVLDKSDCGSFILLSTVGHFSLFPLLFKPELILVKVLLLVVYLTLASITLSELFTDFEHSKLKDSESNLIRQLCLPMLTLLESFYIYGLSFIFLYELFVHNIIFGNSLPFLPLMLISVYSSLGVLYCMMRFYYMFMLTTEGSKGLYKKKVK